MRESPRRSSLNDQSNEMIYWSVLPTTYTLYPSADNYVYVFIIVTKYAIVNTIYVVILYFLYYL
jgi:hypothetical protein